MNNLHFPSTVSLYAYKEHEELILYELFYELKNSQNELVKNCFQELRDDHIFQEMKQFYKLFFNALLFLSLEMLENQIIWRYRFYFKREIDLKYLLIEYDIFTKKVQKHLYISASSEICEVLTWMRENHENLVVKSSIIKNISNDTLVLEITKALLEANEEYVERLISQNILLYENFYLFFEQVLTKAMYIVGKKWHDNEISVAKEHLATALVYKMFDKYKEKKSLETSSNSRIIVATINQELHILASQLIVDLLKNCGYEVLLLRNLTQEKIIEAVVDYAPKILVFSVTLPSSLELLQSITTQIKKDYAFMDVKIVAGGQAFSDESISVKGVDYITNSLESLQSYTQTIFQYKPLSNKKLL